MRSANQGSWLAVGPTDPVDRHSPKTKLSSLAIEPDNATLALLASSTLHPRGPNLVDRAVLDAADEHITSVEDLSAIVRRRVKAIIVLALDDDDYDQSHSEPELGATILVSIPRGNRRASLRVAESIVHEAMHLHLSEAENRASLVKTGELNPLFSPWRSTPRPPSGVLHGYFVFACLHDFFAALIISPAASGDEIAYSTQRMAQIKEEVTSMDLDGLRGCLTVEGTSLVDSLKHLWSAGPSKHPTSMRDTDGHLVSTTEQSSWNEE